MNQDQNDGFNNQFNSAGSAGNPVPSNNQVPNNYPAQPVNPVNNNMGGQVSPMNNMPNNNPKETKNKNVLLYIIIGVVVIGVIVGIILATGKKNKPSSSSVGNYNPVAEKEKILKNIKYKVEGEIEDGSRKELVVSLTSSNKDFVNVSIPIKIYDSNNIQVDDYLIAVNCVESGVELYDIVSVEKKDYARYEIDTDGMFAYYPYNKDDCVSYKGKITSKFETSHEVYGDDVYIYLTNNTKKKLSISGYVLLYLDKKLVGESYIAGLSVDAGGTSKGRVFLPYDEDYNPIRYDDMKFVLSYVM